LTKEMHLSHVIILSSNTIFINRIYNDAKLKVTSKFKKIDHLSREDTFEYLEYKIRESSLVKEEDFEIIWDYLGGCIPLIQRLFRDVQEFGGVKECLEYAVKEARSEVVELMKRFMDDKQRKIFKDVARQIIEKGCYLTQEDESRDYLEVIDFVSEREIFFYEPIDQKVVGNNRLYEKAFEKLIYSSS
ncbi:MAG: ATP-binding protein, partial [Desulfonauticus sp.]|nr:ATP-binding protein [Desulfonauticus sp.]